MRNFFIFSSLLCAALTESADINVEGHEWQEMSFQCAHRLAFNNEKYLCKDPCKSDEDVLVTVSPGKTAESGRITLKDHGDGVFTVTFKQLQLSDSSSYLCGVERLGIDTYTSVRLRVHKAVRSTTEPAISSTWTYLNVTNSTQQTATAENNESTSFSTATNFTNEAEQNIRPGMAVYATVGTVATLAILLLAVLLQKCRKMSKCKTHICSTRNVNEKSKKKADCSRQAPQASPAGTDCSRVTPIYENISFFEGTAGSKHPPADHQNHHVTARIYTNPLPPATFERKADEFVGKHSCKPKRHKSTENSTSKVSHCLSRESTVQNSNKLWFGLDLSKINQS